MATVSRRAFLLEMAWSQTSRIFSGIGNFPPLTESLLIHSQDSL